MLCHDAWNVALGVRSDNFNKKFYKFFKQLSEAGAKLVFFVVGRKLTDDDLITKIPTKTSKWNSKYNRYIRMMNAMENETEFLSKVQIHKLLTYTKENIEYMCRDLGDIHVTHLLHNWEIAEYLCSEPVMALITDDSDFMAIDGDFEYWSLGDINFDTMDGARYSKNELNSKLELIPQRVHSVDVLVGGDSTPSELKSQFGAVLKRLTSWYDWRFNQNVREDSELMEFCKTKHSFIYKLLTYEIFKIAEIIVIDFRMFRNYSYGNMVAPIVMKLCGILRKDEHNPPQTRKIFIKFAHEESAVVRDEEIVYPNSKSLHILNNNNSFPIFTILLHLFHAQWSCLHRMN